MSKEKSSALRLTAIVALLGSTGSMRLPESLTAAAALGDIPRMELFVARGSDINERSIGHGSPLGAACAFGQLESIRWLVDRGALLEPPGSLISPIQAALGKGDCASAEILLDAGLPIQKAAWGVIAAAMLDKVEVIRWLIGRGVDLDESYSGIGLLRLAALRKAKKDGLAEEYLRGPARQDILQGPPPRPGSRSGEKRPIDLAEREALMVEGREIIRSAGKLAGRWIADGPDAPAQRQSILSFAASSGLVEIVGAILATGASPDFAPEGTPPPLSAAAAEARMDVIRLLLDGGASPDGPDGNGWFPLASAAQSGDPEIVRTLLDAGANPKTKSIGGVKLAEHARGPFATEIRLIIENAAKVSRRRRS